VAGRRAKAKRRVNEKTWKTQKDAAATGSSQGSIEESPKPVDFAEVRKDIGGLVGNAAKDIARSLIESAKSGQLATAKYLFEAAGLYPASVEPVPEAEDSLAYTLLKRLGLPTEPWDGDAKNEGMP
jgi:hypothetical protein